MTKEEYQSYTDKCSKYEQKSKEIADLTKQINDIRRVTSTDKDSFKNTSIVVTMKMSISALNYDAKLDMTDPDIIIDALNKVDEIYSAKLEQLKKELDEL